MKHKLLWASALLLIIIGVILFLTARYADRIVDPYVRSLLEQNKPLNHRIDYNKIRVNLIGRTIRIKNVRIYPDASLVKDENIWMEVDVGLIKLTDFNIKDLLFKKTLKIGDFILLKPEVNIHLPLQVTNKTIDKVAEDTATAAKSPLLTSISLDRFLLSEGIFRLIRNDVVLARSNDINFLAQQIELVKNSQDDPMGYTYGEVKLTLSDIILHSETGLYDMSLDHFSLDKKDSTVVLYGFKMKPKYDKKAFSGHLPFQTDRFDIEIGSIEIRKIGYRRLFDGQPLHISKVHLDSVHADISRDKNVAFDFTRFPPYYNESFLKLTLPVLLDTLSVTNSTVIYGELPEGRTEEGIIRLEEFNLQSYNLTNHPAEDTVESVMKLAIQAKVMGEGPMDVELILPLEGDLHKIKCSGSVGAMKLSPLNAMLEPSINMKFNGGMVTRMTFSFTGDDDLSSGWMEFLYKDLDVVLLKKEDSKEKGFISFMANTMALSNNPLPGKNVKSVEIGHERDKNKGLINFVWKTIQSGMVRTIIPMNKYTIKHPEEKKEPNQKEKKKS